MPKAFVDTSFWLAYFLPDETHHAVCQSAFLDVKEEGRTIFTSNFVIHETLTRLLTQTGWQNCKKFLGFVDRLKTEGELVVLVVDGLIEEQAFRIFEKYHDHNFSFTDATIISLVKKHEIDLIMTLDRGFSKIRLSCLPKVS